MRQNSHVPSEMAKGGQDEITGLYVPDRAADVFDDAHRLVAGAPAGLVFLLAAVKPQVRSADRRVRDADDRVGGVLDARIGDVLDANVAGPVKDGCLHVRILELESVSKT